MQNRHPEEYHPKYKRFLNDEIERSQEKFFLRLNRYPYYGYEHDGVNGEAEANARARIRALDAPKEQLARKTPIIQRPIYHINQSPPITYKSKSEVKPMFKYTAGIITGLTLAVIGLIAAMIYFFVIVPQQVQEATDSIINPVTITVEEEATAVWSNEVAPAPTRPELGSGSSKEASDTIHHEGIELIKDRPEGEGRNR